ncbi:MAG: amidohydrolase family protein [Acidimicrobiia bacterium]
MTATDATLRYIDSDGHILEHPTGMLDFAPEKYRDRIWHVEQDADGREWIVYNGSRTPANGLAGTAGFSDEDVDRVRKGELQYLETRPSGWTASLRLQDLDTDGIELSVLYPTFMLGLQSLHDVEFGRVQARAYNDWCASHLTEGQGRLFGAGALPPIHEPGDVPAVVEEIKHVAELPGMVSVFMRPNPAIDWRYFNDPVYDPIWAALQDTELPVAFHPFLAPDLPGACEGLKLGRAQNQDGSYVPLEEYEAAHTAADGQVMGTIYFTQAIANPVDVMSAICYITSGGVAERFPGAKFMFLEANGGWLVPWLERLDHHAKKFSWDVPWLKQLPSEYFRRQCWISFDPDESMLAFTANSPLCGADRIIWASDYPHPDAKFPGVTEELTEAIDGLTQDQKREITSESARALYGID